MSGYTHVPTNYDQSHHLSENPAPGARPPANRRATLRSVLRYVNDNGTGAAGLVELTELLGLDEELAELAGDPERHPERHRAIEAAQLELGLSVDELEDRRA